MKNLRLSACICGSEKQITGLENGSGLKTGHVIVLVVDALGPELEVLQKPRISLDGNYAKRNFKFQYDSEL